MKPDISFQTTKMQRDKIIEKLKERGCRITKQRLAILDIILESECTCCKEICYKAVKRQENVGIATVYRMINTLEEIGALNRKNLYKLRCQENTAESCEVLLDDNTCYHLNGENLKQVLNAGMVSLGYIKSQQIKRVELVET